MPTERLTGDTGADRRARLLEIADKCPVHRRSLDDRGASGRQDASGG